MTFTRQACASGDDLRHALRRRSATIPAWVSAGADEQRFGPSAAWTLSADGLTLLTGPRPGDTVKVLTARILGRRPASSSMGAAMLIPEDIRAAARAQRPAAAFNATVRELHMRLLSVSPGRVTAVCEPGSVVTVDCPQLSDVPFAVHAADLDLRALTPPVGARVSAQAWVSA